ncbi:MAG: 8-oxo-dGTP diphosphatase [Deltaproteobacteria bacterium]|nr:8-oxo-dGTP diphosphatase [Deltaproteobacteria bacterium]
MPNAFEAGHRKVIPAVLVYLERAGDQAMLMLYRNAKPDDYHQGKYNGLGGKCEPDESPRAAARREIEEEAGLRLPPDVFKLCGILQFPNFKPQKSEDWVVWVYVAQLPPDQAVWSKGPEGDLVWVPKSKVLDLSLWQGDRHFLPLVLAKRPFAGTIWYSGQDVLRYELDELVTGPAR